MTRERRRTEDPRRCDEHHLRGRRRQADAGRADPAAGRGRAPRRRSGQQADLLSGMTVVPGQGIDFAALASVLAVVAVIYLVSALFGWASAYIIAGVAQRTVYRLRREVDEKLARLPLRYFDSHPRGDTLSRVTNDIDNIANTLQQTLTQAITSVLTVVGVLIIMFTISPLLAVISLLVVPTRDRHHAPDRPSLADAVRRPVGADRHAQRPRRGDPHRSQHRQGVRPPARGDRHASTPRTSSSSRPATGPSSSPGSSSRSMSFIGNLNYVAIAVIGGVQVANGTMSLGDVQAFIQYSRQFTMPITQMASIVNVLQSAIASAERVFELLDEPEEIPDVGDGPAAPRRPGPRSGSPDVSFRYEPETPLIDDLDLDVEPGADHRDRRADRRRQDDARQPADAVLRDRRRAASRSTGSTSASCHPRRPAPDVRDGPPGHLAVQRHDPREHRLRRRGRHRGADHRRRAGGPRRPLRADPARRLRHRHRRRGLEPVTGREAAAHDRPGVPGRPADPHPRRGDELGRHAHRGPRPAGDGAADAGPDQLRHRPSAVDDPRRATRSS